MAASLCTSFGSMNLSSRQMSFKATVGGQQLMAGEQQKAVAWFGSPNARSTAWPRQHGRGTSLHHMHGATQAPSVQHHGAAAAAASPVPVAGQRLAEHP
jgi:hypothetical protein